MCLSYDAQLSPIATTKPRHFDGEKFVYPTHPPSKIKKHNLILSFFRILFPSLLQPHFFTGIPSALYRRTEGFHPMYPRMATVTKTFSFGELAMSADIKCGGSLIFSFFFFILRLIFNKILYIPNRFLKAGFYCIKYPPVSTQSWETAPMTHTQLFQH